MTVAAPAPAGDGEADEAAALPPGVPAEGLHVAFRGDCWIEVRDGDNAVIHTSQAREGDTVQLTGKEPLTVTLGRADVASIWWNGTAVTVDRFSRAGVARVTVGRLAR